MPRPRGGARERLIEAAEELVLQRGFAATTVDELIAAAETSKGAFFHHFPTKAALGDEVVSRHARLDGEMLDRLTARAERLASDPLGRLLVLVGLLIEDAGEDQSMPGCLFAAFLYEHELTTPASRALIAEAMAAWRRALSAMIRDAIEQRQPARPADPETLADALLATTEGAYVLARAMGDPKVVIRQLEVYRDHLELLFAVR